MEKQLKVSTANKRERKTLDISRSPLRTLSPNSTTDDESDNIKLCLILRFKTLDYLEKVDYPPNLNRFWQNSVSEAPIHLAQSHLQEIAKSARDDQRNLAKHIKFLNKVTPGLGFLVESTGVEFTGLTKAQVRQCASNKALDFEVIEITC